MEIDKCEDVCWLRKCEVVYHKSNNDALLLVEFTDTDSKRLSFIGLYNMQKVTDVIPPVKLFTASVNPVVQSWLLDTTNDYLYISESQGFIYQFNVK